VKNFKVSNYITIITKKKKKPLELPQEKTSSLLENNGDPQKNENP
jgi:hypothetical protein